MGIRTCQSFGELPSEMTYLRETLHGLRSSLCSSRAFVHLAWTYTNALPPQQQSRPEVLKFFEVNRQLRLLNVPELEVV